MANIGNLGSSFVATAPSTPTAGTSLVVTAATGANFPAAPFYATLTPPGSLSTFGTSEIVLVTAKSTDTFTITRAQKSTTAKAVAIGWIITNGIYVEDLMSSITFGEVPTGLVNSSNTVYTTASAFTSIEVFKQGLRLKGGGVDYTVTNNTTITMAIAPATGNVLLVNYIMGNQVYLVGSNSLITDETPSGSVNSSNTAFTTVQPYIGGSLQVFVNGLKQKRGTDFTETTPSTGSFTMSDAPSTGEQIFVCYQFVQSTTANADTVDGIHANATPTANTLLPLGASGTFPGAAIDNLTVARQNDTTNTLLTGARIETGWGYINTVGGVAAALSEAITFRTAFTVPPIVVAVCGGDHASSSVYGIGGNLVEGRIAAKAVGPSTTGFTIWIHQEGGTNIAAGNTFYQWIAIGV